MPEYNADEIADLMYRFPTAFAQAQVDWAKFKEGVKARLFTPEQTKAVVGYYQQFPRLWQTIRDNWLIYPDGRPKPSFAVAYAKKVDTWLSTVDSETKELGLGIAPLIIAGILIAAFAGVAGAVWAVGYVKEQQNISSMIDGVVSGRIPASVLQEAVTKEQQSGLSKIVDLFTWGAVAVGLYLVVPVIKDVLKKK